MKKNYKKNYKRKKFKRYLNKRRPEILIELNMLTFKDLKEMELIDLRTYRESIKKKINSDYQGGNENE